MMRRLIVRGPGLRGPAGIDGIDGADGRDGSDGLPGVNAVPADQAVAAYITGSSQTSAALTAAIEDATVLTKVGNGYVDQMFAAPEADDTPIVTVVTTSGISGGTTTRPLALTADTTKVDRDGDTHFRYDGAPSATLSSGFAQIPYVPASPGVDSAYSFTNRVYFVTPYTNTVEISFKPPQANGNRYRLRINGRWLTIPAVQLDGLTTAAEHFLRLVFPRARVREIGWESATRNLFGGVRLASGQTPTRPKVAQRLRLAIIGDSFADGAGTVSRIETWPNYFAHLWGATEMAVFAIGGSGAVAGTGVTGKGPYSGRVQAVIDYAPDVVIVQGSINDGEPYDSAVQAAHLAVLNSLAAVVPKVIAVGIIPEPYSKGGTPVDFDGGNEAVRGAAVRAGVQFVDPQADAAAGRPWLDVHLTAVDGDDDDLEPDFVHPDLAGARSIGISAYNDIGPVGRSLGSAAASGVPTATVLTASPTSASVGDTVTLTATVSPATPTGTVQFRNGTTILGNVVVTAGVATLAYVPSSGGTKSLSAVFTPDVSGFQPSTGALSLPVIVGPSLGVNDFNHRWRPSALGGSVGDVVTTVPDEAGSTPLVRSSGTDAHFTIQEDSGARYVRGVADAVGGKLFAVGATDVVTVVALMRITKLGRTIMQAQNYNASRAANGTYLLTGAGGNSASIASVTGWVPLATIGDGTSSEMRVGATTAGAGAITGPGSGGTFAVGVSVVVSSLDASGTIVEIAEIATWNRHLSSGELDTVFAALAANSALI